MTQLSNLAEVSSQFSLGGRGPGAKAAASKWWLPKSNNCNHQVQQLGGRSRSTAISRSEEEDSLACEISAFIQSASLVQAHEAIEGLQASGEEISIPAQTSSVRYDSSLDRDASSSGLVEQEALNACLPDLTVNPQPMILDLLPVLRTIARTEEVRRAGGGVKKSRSGRFLHYLEQQEIFIKPASLTHLCNDFK